MCFLKERNLMNKHNKWKIIDLFSGAGGLSNGFEQTGNFEVVGAVENNDAAIKTYITNHNNVEEIILKSNEDNSSDITKLDFRKVLEERELESSETIVLGGPPCQGFSNANRQRNNLISGNNLLVKEYARSIYEISPAAFLMENVETMNSNVHKFFVQRNEEHVTDTNSPSRRRDHLEWLNTAGNKKVDLRENEQIILCEIGEDNIPLDWAEYIVENHNLLGPIFVNENSFKLLKSLERKSRKAGAHVFSVAIKKQIARLKTEIIIDAENPWSLLLRNISENIFEEILNSEKVFLNIYENELNLLVMLNTVLTNFLELRLNDIDVSSVSIDVNKKVVQAEVTTYNVVEYLEAYFEILGYKLAKGVLTASNFGVPQKRNRFFILGVKDNDSSKVELPQPLENTVSFTVHDAIADLEELEPNKQTKEYISSYNLSVFDSPLMTYYRKGMDENIIYNHINTDSRKQILERYQAIKNKNGKNSRDVLELFENGYSKVENIQNTVYLRLNYSTPSPTVVNVRKSMWSHPEKARAISIREAARLQSFQDSYKFEGKKDAQYQQIGNAVPPLLARAIAEKMLNILGDSAINPLKNEFENVLVKK